MSLSRILNDEPSPAVSSRSVPNGSMPVIDPALISPTSPTGLRSPRSHHGPPDGEPQPPPPRGYEYQPVAYQGTGGWDPYSGEWVQGDIFPLGRGNGDYYPHPERTEAMSPNDPRNGYYREEDLDSSSRKRRRGVEDEDDYRSGEMRQGRVSGYCYSFLALGLPFLLIARSSEVSAAFKTPTGRGFTSS